MAGQAGFETARLEEVMPRKGKSGDAAAPNMPTEGPAWEERHEHDARGPLAANTSGISDRSTRNPIGSSGEPPIVHPDGYRSASEGAIPNLGTAPAPGVDEGNLDEERVRQRAHLIWEREGRPDGRQEAHWRAAREELEREAKGQ